MAAPLPAPIAAPVRVPQPATARVNNVKPTVRHMTCCVLMECSFTPCCPSPRSAWEVTPPNNQLPRFMRLHVQGLYQRRRPPMSLPRLGDAAGGTEVAPGLSALWAYRLTGWVVLAANDIQAAHGSGKTGGRCAPALLCRHDIQASSASSDTGARAASPDILRRRAYAVACRAMATTRVWSTPRVPW